MHNVICMETPRHACFGTGLGLYMCNMVLNNDSLSCRQDLKELKFRPTTDVHDYQVRLRAAQKFIAKVNFSHGLLAFP